MAIRLTETRLRQIIREEASRIRRTRLNEMQGGADEEILSALEQFGYAPNKMVKGTLMTYTDQIPGAIAQLTSRGLKATKMSPRQFENLFGGSEDSGAVVIRGPAVEVAQALVDMSRTYGGEYMDSYTAVEQLE